MNIFFLDSDPKLAASYHCDKHVVKMILESAQLLSTAHRVLDGKEGIRLSANGRRLKDWGLTEPRNSALYKATHVNHPSAIWSRQTSENYKWLAELAVELCYEYTLRYGKVHASMHLILTHLTKLPENITISGFSEPPQAMPDYCKIPGKVVEAYRNYYNNEKTDIAVWNYSEIPYWFNPKDLN